MSDENQNELLDTDMLAQMNQKLAYYVDRLSTLKSVADFDGALRQVREALRESEAAKTLPLTTPRARTTIALSLYFQWLYFCAEHPIDPQDEVELLIDELERLKPDLPTSAEEHWKRVITDINNGMPDEELYEKYKIFDSIPKEHDGVPLTQEEYDNEKINEITKFKDSIRTAEIRYKFPRKYKKPYKKKL